MPSNHKKCSFRNGLQIKMIFSWSIGFKLFDNKWANKVRVKRWSKKNRIKDRNLWPIFRRSRKHSTSHWLTSKDWGLSWRVVSPRNFHLSGKLLGKWYSATYPKVELNGKSNNKNRKITTSILFSITSLLKSIRIILLPWTNNTQSGKSTRKTITYGNRLRKIHLVHNPSWHFFPTFQSPS